MKVIFAALFFGLMVGGLLKGEEVPPAFEKAASEKVKDDGKANEEEEHDPFDPEFGAPKLVRVQLEYIEISQRDLTRLMMEEKSTRTDATDLRMIVQKMVDTNEAKIIDTQMVVSRSGQKSTTESRKELIYPTEFEPVKNLPPVEGEQASEKTPKVSSICLNPATPSSFETRNVGSSFEVEPYIGENDKIIDIRILTQYIWYTGNTIWHESKSTDKNAYKIETPEFYLVSIDTSITTITGQYVLVGIVSPKDAKGQADPDRKVMAFLKCDVLASTP